jgi:Tfp pilus assembly protein FimT
MRQSTFTKESGVSLIEVVIIIVVVAVLVTFAVASFRSAGSNLDRQNIAREFKVNLERARFDSVKRRATVCSDMSGVTIDDTSFRTMIDMDNDGQLGSHEVRTVNLASRSDVTIVPNGVTLPLTIRFDQRGQAFLNNCDPGSVPTATIPLLFFCNGTCTPDTANAENSNVIFVSPAGTVAMLYGGETMPTFDEPSMTAVPVDENVNPLLAVWNAITSSSPTPSPSVSPSPTGSPDPSATPTPTGTPSSSPSVDPSATPAPSATPDPTPVACPTSAPWGTPPACTCMYPQTVRQSGQCK